MNKNDNKWMYANKFEYCKDNFDKEVIDNYFDTILHISPDAFQKYFLGLKNQYNTVNYLYILESMINRVITIFNITYRDYCHNGKAYYISKVLDNISDRYASLILIYQEECKQNEIRKKAYKEKEKYKTYEK